MNGRNIIFPIYNEDGTSFHDLVIHKATIESSVMSLGDKLTGDVYYKDNSLADVTNVYVVVDGIKYVLVSPPTIVREGLVSDNSEMNGMTKYSFTFYHPMYMLGNFPFSDIAVTESEEKYLSQNKKFSWIGNLSDFVAKLNANLKETEWLVGLPLISQTDAEKAAKLSEVLSFDNNFVSDALKNAYEQWDIPFTISPIDEEEGGVHKSFFIEFCTPDGEIYDSQGSTFVFQMGQGVGLKNNSRTPRNNKIVTRIVGCGSEKNIPYGYPQIQWYGDQTWQYTEYVDDDPTKAPKPTAYPIYKGILGGQYVSLIKHPFTRTTLMPTVYAEDVFNKVSPYLWNGNANPNYNPYGVIRDYYDADNMYPNPCDENNPCVEIHKFDDIKPELGEEHIVSATPYNNVSENPLETAIALSDFLAQIQYDLSNNVTNQNESVALNSLYTTLNQDWGERHFANQGGSYTFTCDVTKDTDYYYVKYVSDNINYDVICIQSGHTVVPTWDDTMDDNGEYVQSYFKITLPRLGFDMYACASITENMQINMRSGACIGCTFDIQVDWEDYKKNFYNEDGEFDPVIGEGHPRNAERYPDTSQGEVTFIVQKDINTFGTIMPNTYQQPKGASISPSYSGDKFVILGISLPQSYVATAQVHLDDAMTEYMLENNVHYFDYPLKFDEFFLAQNTDILSQISLNKIIRFRFPTEQTPMALFVKSITIKYGQKELPEYDITLTDDIEIALNQIGQVTEDVSRLRVQMSEIQKFYSQDMMDLLQQKLSKVEDDIAQGRITFQQGLNSLASTIFSDEILSNNYKSGTIDGRGWRIDNLGNAEMESLRVRSFLEVTELLINRLQAQEGDTMFTDNDQIDKVDKYQIGGTDIYTLSLKEKYDGYVTSQVKGNILRGVVFVNPANKAGLTEYTAGDAEEEDYAHNKYITSWMKVEGNVGDDPLQTQYPSLQPLKQNQIRVSLYGNGDTPADKNFEPCELMNVVRWGCYQDPYAQDISAEEKASRLRRQNVFYISTKDGRLSKLTGVNQPKLSQDNYGTTLGTIPDFVRNWSIASRLIEGRDYLYAQGIIVEDFIKVNFRGVPLVNYVDCGEWVDGTLLQQPTEGHGIYLFNEYSSNDKQYETHDVWHNGAKWRCKQHQPYNGNYYEPTEANPTHWEKLLDSGTDAASYEVEWFDANGSIENIPCNPNGTAKIVVGSRTDPWITARLYKTVGNGTRSLVVCQRIEIHAFSYNGTESASGFPIHVTENSSITMINAEAYNTDNMKYRVDFYEVYDSQTPVFTAQSSLSRVKDGADGSRGDDGVDGISAPEYTLEWYAWSDDPRNAPISANWQETIPSQGNYAYLWKKIQRFVYDTSYDPPYAPQNPQYFRMTGDSGTSIRVEGTANAVIDLIDSTLPTAEEGQLGVLEDSRLLYEYNNGSWVSTGELLPIDGYVIIKDSTDFIYWDNSMSIWEWTSGYPVVVDGTAYTEQREGHLWMYSAEALAWIDLGQFKGESGRTYYTHIVWATNIQSSGGTILISGYSATKSPSDTTHLWMGTYVDENQADPSSGLDPILQQYTWSYIKGVDGQDGAQGQQGERGKIGRFFYYGGEFNPDDTETLFKVNDAQTPYFKHYESGQARYHVFNPSTSIGVEITMHDMWYTYTDPEDPSFNMYPWESMTDDFKYIISEALFANFAKFGSAIISGDWMISTNGYINGEAYNNGREYNNKPSYTWFDPQHPDVDYEYADEHHNFIPNYCVDLLTGAVYMQNAYIKGVINATSGTFNGNINSTSGTIGCFNIGTATLSNNAAQNGQGIVLINSTRKASIGAFIANRETDNLYGANISSEFTCNELGGVNVAVRATANGNETADNFAFFGVGKVVTNSMMCGYGLDVWTLEQDTYMNLKAGNVSLVKGYGRSVYLPKLSNVRDALKIPSDRPFAVKITLLIGSNDMHIKGYQNNTTYQGDDYPPHQRDNNFSNHPNHDCHNGQVYTYMLVWDGENGHEHYNAWLVGYGDRTY